MGIVRNKLNENPDFLRTGGYDLGWMKDDAMPFGFYKDELFISLNGGTHGGIPGWGNIEDKLPSPKDISYGKPRYYLDYSGRLWKNHKIMSFWKYPPKEKFKEVIDKIGKAIGEPNMFNDPEWKVEIVIGQTKDYPQTEKKDINKDWDRYDEYYDQKLIPLRDYVSSNERSKEDLAKSHVASPMNKLKRPDRSSFFNVRNKKEKPLAWRQAMYAEGKKEIVKSTINESPDMIQADNLKDIADLDSLGWTENEAFAFGYYRDQMMVGKAGENHADMAANRYGLKNKNTGRSILQRADYKYAGRVWPWEKIISFWNYPKPEELKKVLADIEEENRKKYGDSNYVDFKDPNWSIEIISKKLPKESAEEWGHNEWMNAMDATLIPLSQYGGSEDQSKEDQAKQHVTSPMQKAKRPGASDFFSVRDKKEKPLSWKQALIRSESMKELVRPTLNEKLLIGEPVSVPELRDLLHRKVLNFEFIKLDGEVRPAKGTTMMKYIPKDQHPSGDSPSSDKVAAFYDLSKGQWRSVSNRSDEIVIIKDPQTGKPKIVVSDKKPKEEPTKPDMPKEKDVTQRPILPKAEPIVKPSIKPEITPPIPKPEEIEPEVEEKPLDINDPTVVVDEIEPEEIVAPEQKVPEVPEEPEEPASDYEEEKDVSEKLPRQEDITFPPDEEDITFPEDEEEESDEI